jgi:hypothetical protein
MGRACSTNWGEKECIFSVGKPQEKRPLGMPRRRWEDNIVTGLLKELRYGARRKNRC